jgi:hypothetical protein
VFAVQDGCHRVLRCPKSNWPKIITNVGFTWAEMSA